MKLWLGSQFPYMLCVWKHVIVYYLKYIYFSAKIMTHSEKEECVIYAQKKKRLNKRNCL